MKNFNIRYILICVLLIVLVGIVIQKNSSKTAEVYSELDNFDSKMTLDDLSSEDHRIAYAFGVSQSSGLKEYISSEFGIDTLQLSNFEQGVYEGFTKGKDPHKRAYFAGIQIGDQISNRMIRGINYEVFGDDSTKTISLKKFMAGFISATLGEGSLMTVDSATQLVQELLKSVKEKSLMSEFGSNKNAGETFLNENAQKPGVKVLSSGVQYKVIEEGYGAIPSDTSLVKVHYEGRLIDGTVFDSSYKRGEPAEFRANQVIKGWTEVLCLMPAGSVWEVYIPQDMAYGEREQGDIKPFSALIFKIELLEVNPE